MLAVRGKDLRVVRLPLVPAVLLSATVAGFAVVACAIVLDVGAAVSSGAGVTDATTALSPSAFHTPSSSKRPTYAVLYADGVLLSSIASTD